MSLTGVQIGGHHGEELQDAEVVDYVPGWTVPAYRARCSECGQAYPLAETWLDSENRIHCAACLGAAVLADQHLAGVILLGLLHLGEQEMAAVRFRLQQCDDCDCWFSGPSVATHCAPCRRRARP